MSVIKLNNNLSSNILKITSVIPEDNRFTFTVQTSTDNQNVLIPQTNGYTYDYVIDWGDSTSAYVSSYDDPDASHYYTSAGTYRVTVDGSLRCLTCNGTGNFISSLTKINNWGNTRLDIVNFSGCASLNEIPEKPLPSTITSLVSCFSGCGRLTYVPSVLFKNNTGLTNFSSVFFNCTSLTEISGDLFKYNTAINTLTGVFRNCSNLQSIPSGLFANNALVDNFALTFNGCTSLTTVPSGLFDNNPDVLSFSNAFTSCSNIATIPLDLFKNNTLVESFYATFYGCYKLTSDPSTLFNNNTAVTNFERTFYNCTKLSGTAPDLWNRIPVPTGDYCFISCASLSNYASIPIDWK